MVWTFQNKNRPKESTISFSRIECGLSLRIVVSPLESKMQVGWGLNTSSSSVPDVPQVTDSLLWCKKYLKEQNVQWYYILHQNWVCSMSICEGGYKQLYIFACKSNWPKYIILITMIDVRLQSLKPPAIQYASVQPQSTLRMTSRMGCCVLGQGFYPRSCYFKSELLFHQWGRRLFHMCWWHWLPPDDAWGWWTLFLPGISFSQDMSHMSDCELWIFYGNFCQPALCSSDMWKSSQAGLLSWSLGCGREEAPTVFTRSKPCKTFHQQVPHIFQQVMI